MSDVSIVNFELFDDWYDNKSSINNHSVRIYQVTFNYPGYEEETHFYMLDRVTDAIPRYFSLYELIADLVPFASPNSYYDERLIGRKDNGFLDIKWEYEIQVNGRSNWGDGLSWNAAEQKFKERILELWDED